MHIEKLISLKQRRLEKLQEREALSGSNTPPEVLTEIEDLETDIKQLQAELGQSVPQSSINLQIHPSYQHPPPIESAPQPEPPPNSPTIQNSKQFTLPDNADLILKLMFAGRSRVVIDKQFGAGFSGGLVFLLRPIGKNNRPEIPSVVKLAATSLIQKEWNAYDEFVRNHFPASVGIEDPPVLPQNSTWAGLRYLVAGHGAFNQQSLHDYCQNADLEDVRFTLSRLLKVMDGVLKYNQSMPQMVLRPYYERYLPVNLLVEVGNTAYDDLSASVLSASSVHNTALKQGSSVRLEGFIVTKIDLKNSVIDLNLPTSPDDSYTLRLKAAPQTDLPNYEIGQTIQPIAGVILETRQERILREARNTLGRLFDLDRDSLSLPNGPVLPNPIRAWPDFLTETRDLKFAIIHGDLNMENILVDADTRDVSLIDFADARRDHTLHDFLRLETETVVKIMAPLIEAHLLRPENIHEFYHTLHTVIVQNDQTANPPRPMLERPWRVLLLLRDAAQNYLFQRNDWSEYYHGLALYLLGAMKFGNLDRTAKQLAFWGSAVMMGLVKNPQVVMGQSRTSHQRERVNKAHKPSSSFRQTKIQTLKKRLAALLEEYEAVNNQIDRALSDTDRKRLERHASALAEEIEQIERELEALQ